MSPVRPTPSTDTRQWTEPVSVEDRIGVNQATTETSATVDLITACQDAGVGQVSLWRHKYVENDAALTRRVAADHGVRVTSLCRAGFFTDPDRGGRERDNLQAVQEAAELGAPTLVLVCGPATDGDIPAAEAMISRGVERLLPYAREAGVRLALEPFHPMFAAERSALITLGRANDLLDRFDDDHLGLALDTYHVWWDPAVEEGIERAGDRLAVVHLADWLVPTTDLLAGRGLPGEGVAPLARLLAAVARTGYRGTVETEVLNPRVWARDPRALVPDLVDRTRRLMERPGTAAAPRATAGGEPAPRTNRHVEGHSA